MQCLGSSCTETDHDFKMPCSRPRNVKDVAHQEEVVATLTKALETANVGTVKGGLAELGPIRV